MGKKHILGEKKCILQGEKADYRRNFDVMNENKEQKRNKSIKSDIFFSLKLTTNFYII